MSCEEALTSFFAGNGKFEELGVGELDSTYNWTIPRCEFLPKLTPTVSLARDNINLKFCLHESWLLETHPRLEIAIWIVRNWGGIRRISTTTLEAYVERTCKTDPLTPIKGISSFSKILAIVDPSKYVIYDARVAVSLNAIQLINGTKNGLAFPYLPGRNKITGDSSSRPRRGFSNLPKYSIENLTARNTGWCKVTPNDAYQRYLIILKSIIKKNPQYKLHELEMTLFAQAEMLAVRAEPSLKV